MVEPIAKGMSVVLDNLTVVDGETQETQVVEDFESLTRTKFLNIMAGESIHVGLVTRPASWEFAGEPGSGQLVAMTFIEPGQTYPLRVRQTWTAAPLPALASPAFLETTKLQAGDVVRTWVGDPEQVESYRGGGHQGGLAEIDFRIVGAAALFSHHVRGTGGGFPGHLARSVAGCTKRYDADSPPIPTRSLIQTDGSTSLDILSPMVPHALRELGG